MNTQNIKKLAARSLMLLLMFMPAGLQAQEPTTEMLYQTQLDLMSNLTGIAVQNAIVNMSVLNTATLIPLISATLATLNSEQVAIITTASTRTPPALTPEEKEQLGSASAKITNLTRVMGKVNSPAVIPILLSLSQQAHPATTIHEDIFAILSGYTPTPAILDYARSLLQSATSSNRQRRAVLIYLADAGNSSDSQWINAHLDATVYPIQVRSAAAYLAGRLNQTTQLAAVRSFVMNTEDTHWKLYAIYGLAFLESKADFAKLDLSRFRTDEREVATQINLLAHNPTIEEITNAANVVFTSDRTAGKLLAFEKLLDNQRIDLLEQYNLLENTVTRTTITTQLASGELSGNKADHWFLGLYRGRFNLRQYKINGTDNAPVFTNGI